MRLKAILAAAALLFAGTAAHADYLNGTFNVTVSEGLTNGSGFDTTGGNPFSGSNSASATFTYTGALGFSDTASQNGPGTTGDTNTNFGFSGTNISNYSGSGTVTYNSTVVADYSSLGTFLTSSGSASNYDYGSYYTFDLGTLTAGTVLTITHDDGVSAYDDGVLFGSTTSGPTTAVTNTVTVGTTGDVVLRYGRENGTPSVFEVSAVAPTPEPSSIALLGTGLLGFAGALRRRMKR